MQNLKITPTKSRISGRRPTFTGLSDALDYATRGDTGYNFYDGAGRLESVLPYGELQVEAKLLASKLLSLGLPRYSPLVIIAETTPLFHRFFFACQYAGFIPVPLPSAVQMGGGDAYVSQIHRMLDTCGAKAAVAPEGYLDLLLRAGEGLDFACIGSESDFDALPISDKPLVPLKGEEPAYLQYTSGSTRFPRGVEMTQTAVLHNLNEIADVGVKLTDEDRLVSWLPFYHDMGLVAFVLLPIIRSLSVDYLSPRTFAMRPRLWLKLITENKCTASSSPPSGYALCATRLKAADHEKYDLSSWRVACVGAERINDRLLEHFAEVMKPAGFDANAFIACYGMAECGLAISFAPLNQGVSVDEVDKELIAVTGEARTAADDQDALRLVDCGAMLPSNELEICDNDGNPLGDRQCGHIKVRGPSIMRGYYNDPVATAEVLDASGWLDTGDVGYRIGQHVIVTARSKDVIIVNGRNIWPQDIEQLAEKCPGVRTGDTTAFEVRQKNGDVLVVLVVESKKHDTELPLQISALVRENFGVNCHVDLVPPRTLPRTSSGKLSRTTAASGYLARMRQLDAENEATTLKDGRG